MATVNETTAAATTGGVVKRKPVFVKVTDLKPGTNGHTLAVKVMTATTVLDKKSRNTSSFSSRPGAANTRIAECLIGDETGTILFTARNDQGLFLSSSFFFMFYFILWISLILILLILCFIVIETYEYLLPKHVEMNISIFFVL